MPAVVLLGAGGPSGGGIVSAERTLPPQWVLDRVLRLVGIRDLDVADDLQYDIARSVFELGPGATDGVLLQRIRWHFAWHLKTAGKTFADAKADFESLIDRETVRLRAGEKPPTRAEAEQIVRAGDDAYRLKLAFLVAEQRERAMRKFLDAVDSAIELHRTDRADARKADFHHADGVGS